MSLIRFDVSIDKKISRALDNYVIENHMIEFKRKHVMNIIFNHVRFPRLSA